MTEVFENPDSWLELYVDDTLMFMARMDRDTDSARMFMLFMEARARFDVKDERHTLRAVVDLVYVVIRECERGGSNCCT